MNAASISFEHGHDSPAVVAYTRDALYSATDWIFWALLAASLFGLAAQLLLPRRADELLFEQ